ncbi:magnesium/cobalt transporter CorA [Burkholderia oklahomensis]|uniref:magnesium/cobalt transporter CorA n=1 Tax=Burkholderia oklahomensis TaxID=342113 RepID=UPI00016A7873|nr:magnesium/cobalt transporter CorA [Burkholderia oklahomensis]AJX32052.1 magnesium and cobalt transport protein CorA [Burkholderia oklahomensis C6786]AOI45913.1 magnesium transporter [Burkholderia oklahomensis C6786]KUY52892.1 magnesium transporter [Burkholderia oklahomensis C6786]MBI0361542.1 magnesium/cobalt transporter CorA [Burkholderia oklahomensis]SUW55610.1 Magnesium transport protein CorA [Burkholderia oklahomensis]
MLINCAAYQDGRKLADIDIDDIGDYVAKPECFVWVALKDPEPDEIERMGDEFGLHELALEDARKGHQRPKIEEYGDALFAVLHTVEIDEQGELQLGELNVFVGPNYVLSIRNHTEQDFRAVRVRCEREPHLLKEGSAYVFYALMDQVVDRYFPTLEALSAELEALEDRIFEKTGTAAARALIEDLYTLKRRLVMLHQHTAPLVEPLAKLVGGRIPQVCVGMDHYFRDVYDHLLRIVRTIEGRREMLVTAIQVNLGMISLAESEVTKRLGSFAALFAIPTMIAGIYGMNFNNIPELHWRFGFYVCLGAMAAADLFLWRRFRKAGWL